MPSGLASSEEVAVADSAAAGKYAHVAALLHESRRAAPDQLGSFLAARVELSHVILDHHGEFRDDQRHSSSISRSSKI